MNSATAVMATRTLAPPLFAIPLLASLASWLVLWIALPAGKQDFPLMDDWVFSRNLFDFIAGKGLHYFYLASIPQLGQWLWALPFVGLFGTSHAVLRISTLVLSWLGLWAFYDLLRQEGCSEGQAALGTATLALNPLFFLLQGTFMTDVPALTFALGALACYGRAVRRERLGWLVAATAMALLAVLTRQNMVVAPLTGLLMCLRSPTLRWRPACLLLLFAPLVAAAAVHFWFNSRPDVLALSPQVAPPHTVMLLPLFVLHWCGLAVLPLLLVASWLNAWKACAGAFVLLIGAAVYWLYYPQLLPYGGLFPYTEGLLTLDGVFTSTFYYEGRAQLLTPEVRWAITALGCLAGAGLIGVAVAGRRGLAPSPLLVFTALNIPFLFVVPAVYDRYALMLFPGVIYLACARVNLSAGRVAAAALALGVVGVVSIGLMHDWLAWNSARWELGRRALANHVPSARIEGGFEWDGWYAPRFPNRPLPKDLPKGPGAGFISRITLRHFPHISPEYTLTTPYLPGSIIVDEEPYSVWLPPQQRRYYLLRDPRFGKAAPERR